MHSGLTPIKSDSSPSSSSSCLYEERKALLVEEEEGSPATPIKSGRDFPNLAIAQSLA